MLAKDQRPFKSYALLPHFRQSACQGRSCPGGRSAWCLHRKPESRRRLQSLEREQPHESTRTSELRPALPGCLGTCEVRLRGICRAHPSMSGDRGWFDDAAFGGPDSAMASSQACARRRAVWQRKCGSTAKAEARFRSAAERTHHCLQNVQTHVFAAYLSAGNGIHAGHFMRRRHSLLDMVSQMAKRTQRNMKRTGLVHYHVVHDELNSSVPHVWRGVSLHRVRPRAGDAPLAASGNDQRWAAYSAIWRKIRLPVNACVWLVDLGDVLMVNNATHLCMTSPPDTLFAATDVCDTPHVKLWMARHAQRVGYQPSQQLASFLKDRNTPLLNCGVVGSASFHTLRAFTRAMAERVGQHFEQQTQTVGRSSQEPGAAQPVDMLAFNELLLVHRGRLSVGWPVGNVTAPMWGNLCSWGRQRCQSNVSCTRGLLADLVAHAYFTHKL